MFTFWRSVFFTVTVLHGLLESFKRDTRVESTGVVESGQGKDRGVGPMCRV